LIASTVFYQALIYFGTGEDASDNGFFSISVDASALETVLSEDVIETAVTLEFTGGSVPAHLRASAIVDRARINF